ncbi:MAG: hypothetical protein EOO57_05400 [Hymenobacter sp.]|nr:MAG: hypothetical protein EOO57_05400 [Hymenobacter sp.]
MKGHKRLVVLDPPGNVLANRVLPAHMSDAAAAIAFRGEVAARQPLLAQVQVVLGNSSFAGQFAEHLGRC